MRLAAHILLSQLDGPGGTQPPPPPPAGAAAATTTTTITTTMNPIPTVLAALARLHFHALAALSSSSGTPQWDRRHRRLARALSASLWAAAPAVADPAAWPTHPWLRRLLQRQEPQPPPEGGDDDDDGSSSHLFFFFPWLAAHALPAFATTLGGFRYLTRHGDAGPLVVAHLVAQTSRRLETTLEEEGGGGNGGPAAAAASITGPLPPLPLLARLLQHAAVMGGPVALALRPLLCRLRAFVLEEAPRRYGVRLAEHVASGAETQPPALAAHAALLWGLLGPLAAAAAAGAGGAGGVDAEGGGTGGMLEEVRCGVDGRVCVGMCVCVDERDTVHNDPHTYTHTRRSAPASPASRATTPRTATTRRPWSSASAR